MFWEQQPEEVKAIFLNLLKLFKECVTLMPDKASCFFEVVNDVVFFNTEVPYPNMNGMVCFEKHLEKIQSTLLMGKRKFKNTRTPVTFFWPHSEDLPTECSDLLGKKDFKSLGKYTCVMASPESILGKSIALKPNQTIHRVLTQEDFDAFMTITQKGFEMPDAAVVPMSNLYKAYARSNAIRLYLAKVDGVPASVLLAFIDGQTVGLYNGATLKSFQKQGLMAALAQHAVREAEGCSQVVAQLMAAQQAKGLCDLFGAGRASTFEPFCHGFEPSQLSV